MSQAKRKTVEPKAPPAAKKDPQLLPISEETEEEKATRDPSVIDNAFVQLIAVSDQGSVDEFCYLPAKSFTENELAYMQQNQVTFLFDVEESVELDRLLAKFKVSDVEHVCVTSYKFANRKILCTFTVSYADV